MKEREREIAWVLKIQSYRTPLLDRYFALSSLLGEEYFYILAIPLSSWVVSTQFAIHLTMLLAMSVGFGNVLKNFFLIPRPPHPPVWAHAEHEKDHGLPSTHTMTAITMPWYFILFTSYLEPSFPLPPLVSVLVFVWTASVVASRVYNGHHTPLDVIGGTVLGIGILVFWTFQLRLIVDSIVVNGTLAGILSVFATSITILALHPTPPKIPTPAHAETGLVTGTTTGATLGLWLRTSCDPRSVYLAYHSLFHMDQPYPPHFPHVSDNIALVCVLRFVVGVIFVMIARAAVKKLGTLVVLQIARMFNNKKYSSKAAFKYSEAEVAVKFLTYTAVGFSATFASHIAFVFLGLHLPLDDEIITKHSPAF